MISKDYYNLDFIGLASVAASAESALGSLDRFIALEALSSGLSQASTESLLPSSGCS